MSGHVHKMVAKVAREAAEGLYERLMGDNLINTEWRRQNQDCTPRELERRFVLRNWGKCIPFARATLARLLADPHLDERTKESIMEALVLDASLMRGRADNQKVIGSI